MAGIHPDSESRTDWQNQRFDARNSGYHPDDSLVDPVIAWEIGRDRSPSIDQPGAVVATNGTVYFTSPADETIGVTAVDLRTADVRWTYEADESVMSLATDGDAVYAATSGGIVAVDAASGAARWRNESALRQWTRPVVSDGTLFASVTTADDVGVVAIDARTGTQSWQDWSIVPIEETSLAADEQHVYANTMDGLYAFDRHSGEVAWANGAFNGDLHTPVADEETVYLGNFDGDFCAFDSSTGERQWRSKHGGSYFSPVVTDDVVVTVGEDGLVRSHSPSTGSVQWSWGNEETYQLCSDPVCVGETVFLNTAESLYAINVRTGQPRWELGLESEFGGALAAAGSRLLVPMPGLAAIGSGSSERL